MSKYLCQAAKELDKQSAAFKRSNTLESLRHSKDYFLQPKFDGCHGIVHTSPENGMMTSRTGEEVKSCDHIIKDVINSFGPGWVVFGEVYKFDTKFSIISGMFRRYNPEPTLVFVVYDVVSSTQYALGQSIIPYFVRLKHAKGALQHSGKHNASLIMCPSSQAEGTDVVEYANNLVATGGYDGAILRNAYLPWSQEQSKNGEIIKIKPVQSLDLLCVDVVYALGAKTGRATCALIVEYEGVRSKVSTGLSVEEQANPAQFIGKIIEVEFMERTDSGAFREPRFKGVRTDKVKPD